MLRRRVTVWGGIVSFEAARYGSESFRFTDDKNATRDVGAAMESKEATGLVTPRGRGLFFLATNKRGPRPNGSRSEWRLETKGEKRLCLQPLLGFTLKGDFL